MARALFCIVAAVKRRAAKATTEGPSISMPRPRAAGLESGRNRAKQVGTGSSGGAMRRISEMAGTRFDGVANPYVPSPALAISGPKSSRPATA